MKYHQIEAFYQVMLTGSISKAAKNLGRTQPAVSMTISTLEDQLSTVLFDRHAGRITPRAEADVLFGQINPLMSQINDIRNQFGQLARVEVPRISIISSNNAGNHLVPAALAKIASQGQQLRLMIASSDAIISEMENQLHDIALTDEGRIEVLTGSSLFEAEVFEIPVYAVCPKGLLGNAGEVSIKSLTGMDISILYEENRTTHEIRTQLPPPRVEFSAYFPMACFSALHGGVAVVDSITCSTMQALTCNSLAVDYHPITDVRPARYYLIRSRYRQRSKVADQCYEALSKALHSHKPN
ncbi:LysR family transcriptional regulator [Aquamicrobium segne]|uniref:LysR family transcriptional regulator n=1 Tax=Aquamicrobium segne TaxID=469547 RepID=A0ABW0H0B0_9HYPH